MNERYIIIFDDGKPFEVVVYGELELTRALKDFYNKNKENDGFYDCRVYLDDDDISESQFITEIIGGIIENE